MKDFQCNPSISALCQIKDFPGYFYFAWKDSKGPFKYYVIKEVGGWGQKTAIFDDLQYCKSSKRWLGGPKNVKNMTT